MGAELNHRVLKAITTNDITGAGKGGRMNPQQARQFIQTIRAENQFLQEIRFVDMTGPEYDLDYLNISNRLIRRGVEGQEPTNTVGIQTARRKLQTIECILPVDISKSFLEDNIEREGAEDTIARMVATQFGNDLLDLAINGDVDYSGVDEDFIRLDDGWIKKAKSPTYATHKVDTGGSTDLKNEVFPEMVDRLPEKWKANKDNLRIVLSANDASRYARQVVVRETALGDDLLVSGRIPPFEGIRLRPVPYWPDGVFMLTFPQNLAMGVQRDFTVDREWKPRRRVVEYTLTNRIDPAEIVLDDAVVIAYEF